MGSFLFVYGTLLQRSSHPMARWLADRARWVGEAQILGQLFDLGGYPGLVPPARDTDLVYGDLYDLGDRLLEVLSELDRYEGTAYERRRTDTLKSDGWPELAWVYWYRGPVNDARRIASGRYVPASGNV